MSADAPKVVTIKSVGSTGLDIAWTRPDSDADSIISYSFGVFIREKGTEEYVLVHQARDEDDYEFLCEDLKQATAYEIYVQSFGVQPGECSSVQEVSTSAAAPNDAPRNLVITQEKETPTSAVLTWSAPEQAEGTAPITGYKLFYDKEDMNWFDEVGLGASQFEYCIEEVDLECVYRFQVLAFNDDGEGPETPILRWSANGDKRASVGGVEHMLLEARQKSREYDALVNLLDRAVEPEQGAHISPATFRTQSNEETRAQANAVDAVAKQEPRGAIRTQPGAKQPIVLSKEEAPRLSVQESVAVATEHINTAAKNDLQIALDAAQEKLADAKETHDTCVAATPDADACDAYKTALVDAMEEVRVVQAALDAKYPAAEPVAGRSTLAFPATTAELPAEAAAADEAADAAVAAVPKREKKAPPKSGAARRVAARNKNKSQHRSTKKRNSGRMSWVVMSRSRTIRGKKNGVLNNKKLFSQAAADAKKEFTPLARVIEEEKENRTLILYTTSVGTIRSTYSACEKAKNIFYGLRVKIYIRDVAMDKQYARDLGERLPGQQVPQLFASGEHIGGYEEILKMNEVGEIKRRLDEYAERPLDDCLECGGTGFVVCRWCGGSGKSTPIGHAFQQADKGNASAFFLKCTVCNENNLERCRAC